MRFKILSPVLFLAVVSSFTPPVEATSSRWPGASCQSIDNSSDISFNSAGVVLNSSTTAARTVVCPVQMPTILNSDDGVSVVVQFDTTALALCVLRLTNSSGTVLLSESGVTPPGGGPFLLAIENDTGIAQPLAANLRCSLPAASASGPQGIVSYVVNLPD